MTSQLKTKKCPKCHASKTHTNFYKRNCNVNGKVYKYCSTYCKTCSNAVGSAWAKTQNGRTYKREVRKNDRTRMLEKMRMRKKRTDPTYMKKLVEGNRKKYWENRDIQIAGMRVRHAIANGKIKRKPCEVCGRTRSHAHHDDYRVPLAVRFLCSIHHKAWHQKNKPLRNLELIK